MISAECSVMPRDGFEIMCVTVAEHTNAADHQGMLLNAAGRFQFHVVDFVENLMVQLHSSLSGVVSPIQRV